MPTDLQGCGGSEFSSRRTKKRGLETYVSGAASRKIWKTPQMLRKPPPLATPASRPEARACKHKKFIPGLSTALPNEEDSDEEILSFTISPASKSEKRTYCKHLGVLLRGPLLAESRPPENSKFCSPLESTRNQVGQIDLGNFEEYVRHLLRSEDLFVHSNADSLVVSLDLEIIRKHLVTRIIRTHWHCMLQLRTLYLAIAIFDKYLMSKRIALRPSYPLAATALLVASKFEEELFPGPDEIVMGFGMKAFDVKEMVLTEAEFLYGIDFNFHGPTPGHFLHVFVEMLVSEEMNEGLATKLSKMAHFLCELGCLSGCSMRWPPSLHAAGAALLAAAILKTTKHNEVLQNLVAPSEQLIRREQLHAIMERLEELLVNEEVLLDIVYFKYLTKENLNISGEARHFILIDD
jgi:hypothetical protein